MTDKGDGRPHRRRRSRSGSAPTGGWARRDRSRSAASSQACDNARLQASYADSQRLFQDLIGEANRASTSFYTLDAMGLRTEGRPHHGDAAPGASPRCATASACPTRRRSTRSAPSAKRPTAWRSSTATTSRRPAAGRRRLQLLLPARLHVDQRQGGRQVPQDQGDREAAGRPGARARGLPGPRRRPSAPASSTAATPAAPARRTRRRRSSPPRWAG